MLARAKILQIGFFKVPIFILVCVLVMAIRVVEFSKGGYKIRKIFVLESTYPKEIIEFLVFDYW